MSPRREMRLWLILPFFGLLCAGWELSSAQANERLAPGDTTDTGVIAGNAVEEDTTIVTSDWIPWRPGSVKLLPESGVVVVAEIPETTTIGRDIIWRIRLTNSSRVPRSARINIRASAAVYNGTVLGEVDSLDATVDIEPDQGRGVELVLTPESYLAWTGKTEYLQGHSSVRVLDTEDLFFYFCTTSIIVPRLKLVALDTWPAVVGDRMVVKAKWANPLSVPLSDAEVRFSVGRELSLGGASESVIHVGEMAPSESLSVTQEVTAVESGRHYVSAMLTSDKVYHLHADVAIDVHPDCNGNGLPDEEDLAYGTSLDCNANRIPDDCETDCNGDGIPDDCDISDGLVADCNANHIPDVCDIASGVSLDANENGIPDECDPDCNYNDVPDDFDITSGRSHDANRNWIPDECDYDCNENGVSDEMDIATGTSQDEDWNGVPDECETAASGLYATVVFNPKTVNVTAENETVTCYIELPEGYDPAGIDVATVRLNDDLPAEPSPSTLGDFDMDGVVDRMVGFRRDGLVALLAAAGKGDPSRRDEEGEAPQIVHGTKLQIVVSGELKDGTSFSGVTTVRFISPRRSYR
jgi:hypothetical protein